MIDTLLPQRCALCGSLVRSAPWHPAPLCAVCESGLEVIRGKRCALCGRPLISEDGLCMECRDDEQDSLKIMPLFMYRGAVAALLHQYKTQERFALAEYFAFKMVPIARSMCAGVGCNPHDVSLVPVPPRPEKLRSGKRDQIGMLARSLRAFGFQSVNALVRCSNSPQQKTLARVDRFRNAATAYTLKSIPLPEHTILIDDVATTGATLRACARILKRAGSDVIAALVIAAD